MKKKLIAVFSTAVVAFAVTVVPVVAAPYASQSYGCGMYGAYGGYGIMCDQYGNLLDKDAFMEKLDKMVAEGLVREEDKSYLINMYERCAAYGTGVRACCAGRGAGRYR